jgi:hypothetical protein
MAHAKGVLMSGSIAVQVQVLQKMTIEELRIEWEKTFGKPTKQRHRSYLWRRLAKKLQEDGLPKLTPEEKAKVAAYRDLIRQLPPDRWFPSKWSKKTKPKKTPFNRQSPPPGSVISREYKGEEIIVKFLDDGFEYDGKVFRSLSAIAKDVTGTVWNGPAFFGLRKRGRS